LLGAGCVASTGHCSWFQSSDQTADDPASAVCDFRSVDQRDVTAQHARYCSHNCHGDQNSHWRSSRQRQAQVTRDCNPRTPEYRDFEIPAVFTNPESGIGGVPIPGFPDYKNYRDYNFLIPDHHGNPGIAITTSDRSGRLKMENRKVEDRFSGSGNVVSTSLFPGRHVDFT